MARTTIPPELVAVNAIQGTLIADNSVTAVHIATNAISGTLVADNAITSTHIAQNNVTATQIAQNTITVTQVADSAIETAKINNDAVTQAKIADDAVGPDQLAANSVVSASIANGTIVEADMADNAVTLAKMASLARGKIIVGDSAGDPSALAIGSNGTVLKSDGTDVSWGAASSGLPLSGGTLTGTLNITQASTADTIKLTRGTTSHNNMIKFVTGSSDKWIVGQRNDSTDHFRFYSYGTSSDVLSIQTDGNVNFGAGLGIGGTGAANTLDDYEEGTWTPAFYTYSGVTTSSITNNLATYTKIGNIVHIHANIDVTLSSLPGQIITITGLPFAASNASATGQRAIIALGGDTANMGGNTPKAHFRTNGSQLDGIAYNASSNTAYWTYSSMDAQPFEMSIHGFYTT